MSISIVYKGEKSWQILFGTQTLKDHAKGPKFYVLDITMIDYASDIDKWCYIKDLLALLQKVDSYK